MPTFHQAGSYRAKILSVEIVQAQSGTEQIRIALELQTYYAQGTPGVPVPPSRFPPEVYMPLTEATMGSPTQPGWVAETLAGMGFDGDFSTISEQFEGKVVDVGCRYEYAQQGKHQGEEVERWSIYRPGGTRAKAPADPKQGRRLTSQWGALFGRPGGNTTQTKRRKTKREMAEEIQQAAAAEETETAAAVSDGEEDIPF